ncbi:MAG: universal stress protein [Acidimicrobiales bacterium]
MFKRIVVGTDGSKTANAALKTAAELSAQCGADLHIVSGYHAKSSLRVSGAGSGVEPWMVSSTDQVEGILRDAAEIARRQRIAVTTHHESGDPAKALVAIVKQVDADLVVVGNRGMRGVKRLLLGSVPNDVAHNSPCHVLILKTT